MKKIIFAIIILLSLSTVLANHQKIDLEQLGYGKSQREVNFGVRNAGNETIDGGITIYLDGEVYKKTKVYLTPTSGYVATVLVDVPGEHFLLVATEDGSSDSATFFTTNQKEKQPMISTNFVERNKTVLSIAVVLAIFGIAWWVVTRKPKLKL